jgi:RNA polymerase sigma-54 factor
MKPTLSLKLGQQLTMTPQLQQAIRLLQLSTLDLQQEIQQAVESNPLLELEDEFPDRASEQFEEARVAGDDTPDYDEPPYEAPSDLQALDDTREAAIPEELPIDTQWDDIFQDGSASSGQASSDDDWDMDQRNSGGTSLHDHLRWQLNLCHLSERDRLIGEAIIDSIDDDGLLACNVEEICASLNGESTEAPGVDPDDLVEVDEVVAVLKHVQQFEPVGVAARDLCECLLLQLRQYPPDTPWLAEAGALVASHLDLLGARDFGALMRYLRLSEDALAAVVQLIQTLNPRPGGQIASQAPEYIVPDVFVTRRNNRWVVELNADATPRLRINETYASLIRRADSSADNVYLKDHLQEARWFLKSLQSRNETLLKVATKIVERQRGFLEYGPEAMKPLVLADIAEAIGMHESTISRVTNRKYMHTPRGIFELKYFFSSHVSTQAGGEVSSTAIRAIIKKLTAEENPRKPLSDQKIAAILAEQNIVVARRTVAKYRESLAIPPSSERKRLI